MKRSDSIPQEAKQLLEDADKLAEKARHGSRGFLSFFTGGGNSEEHAEDAADLYTKAGNLLKAEQKWKPAAEAFIKAAELHEREADSKEEGARKRVSAASCYRKYDAAGAIEQLEKAVQVYLRAGRFSLVATYEKESAEIWEGESKWKEASECYVRAAKRYEAEDQPAMAQGCWAKAALAYGWMNDWTSSTEVYETIAQACATDHLRKFSSKDFYFRAVLCTLANGDVVGARKKAEGWLEKGRELQLSLSVVQALEDGDLEAFSQAVATYDQVASLDDWKMHVLLEIKKSIDSEPSLA